MSGYVYRGTGRDTLTPDPGDVDIEPPPTEPDTPLAISAIGYDQIRRRYAYPEGCDTGVHSPLGTTDRAGAVTWACRRCQAIRSAGDPTWRTPTTPVGDFSADGPKPPPGPPQAPRSPARAEP